MELENVNLKNAVLASNLSPKLNHLKWVTPFSYSKKPQEELNFLKKVIKYLKEDSREKIVITNYQFFSLLLNEDLNILNRWYFGSHTHPLENHKYFDYYRDFVNKNLEKNNIKVIYFISTGNELSFEKFKVYFSEKCFKNNYVIKKKFSIHEIRNCN